MNFSHIRNFCIIAHIDHGKSTLADRMLEFTHTIEKRKMQEQVLDRMPLERERGITIKMQPVRMRYVLPSSRAECTLNLIDTPGHIDFGYEVSRALLAVEGAVLLVDATRGVQAQTIANLELAKKFHLSIVPVINKIDLPDAEVDSTRADLAELLECEFDDILLVSAKTGVGVGALLDAIVERIPFPQLRAGLADKEPAALIFDSHYSSHKGALAYVRVFGGSFRVGEKYALLHKQTELQPIEVGTFSPDLARADVLGMGEIGYIATNLKDPSLVRVGDVVLRAKALVIDRMLLGGYQEPRPVVWASVFPENADEFDKLHDAFLKLRLNDASLSFEIDSSTLFGRSLRVGFLGLLHLEITIERITREFGLSAVVASPSIEYDTLADGKIMEPWFFVSVIGRVKDLGSIMELIQKNEGMIQNTKTLARDRILLESLIPLRKLVSDFFDDLKSITQGYGSMSYEFFEKRLIDLVKMEVLIADKEVPQFSRLIPRWELEYESRKTVERLYDLLPRQLFLLKIQARGDGRIVASRTLPASGKNVTAKLYGGDRSRKMKLWKKQKEGKKRLEAHADVDIPHDIYLKMIRK